VLLLSVGAGVFGSPDAGATAPATLDADASAIGGDVPGYPRKGDLTTTLALAFLCTVESHPQNDRLLTPLGFCNQLGGRVRMRCQSDPRAISLSSSQLCIRVYTTRWHSASHSLVSAVQVAVDLPPDVQ
jgi:hypothetical protein